MDNINKLIKYLNDCSCCTTCDKVNCFMCNTNSPNNEYSRDKGIDELINLYNRKDDESPCK